MITQILSNEFVERPTLQASSHWSAPLATNTNEQKLATLIGLHHLRDLLAKVASQPKCFFQEVTEAIHQLFGYPVVAIYSLSQQTLILRHAIGLAAPTPYLSIDCGVVGRATRTKQAVFLPDVQQDRATLDVNKGHTSEIAVPLCVDKKIVGVLNIATKDGHKLTAEDYNLILSVAKYVSQGLEQSERAELQAKRAIELEAAAQMQNEFFASLSHDLRNPINAILTLTETLVEGVYGEITPRQQRSLYSIERSSKNLLTMLNDIIDLAKVGTGKLQLEIQSFSVAELIDGTLQLVTEAAFSKGITLTKAIDANICTVEADLRRLAQMVVTLLSNAIKSTPAKGIIHLTVCGASSTNNITLSVWDSGPRLSPTERQQLFQPFTQLEDTLTRLDHSIALGVALVRSLAELHGGALTLESDTEYGNRFAVTIPRRQDDKPILRKD